MGNTIYAYDAMGDVTSESYQVAGGYTTPPNVSYTYFVDGSRKTMTDGTGTTTYSYDAMGDVTSQALKRRERVHLEHGRAHVLLYR